MFARNKAATAARKGFHLAIAPVLAVILGTFLSGRDGVCSQVIAVGYAGSNWLTGVMTSVRLERSEVELNAAVEDLEKLSACCSTLDAQIEALEKQQASLTGRIAQQRVLLKSVFNTISHSLDSPDSIGSFATANQDAVTLLQSLEADCFQFRNCETALQRAIEHRAALGQNAVIAGQSVRHHLSDLERGKITFEVEKTFLRGIELANRLKTTRRRNCAWSGDLGVSASETTMLPEERKSAH